MSYYITDKIWQNMQPMASLPSYTVFVEGYKGFWQLETTDAAVVTLSESGRVMTLEEVLDCLILYNHIIMPLQNCWFLPVKLSLSDDKLLKVLNLVGLILQTQRVYWLIPLLLSITSAMLEFSTKLRELLYSIISAVNTICECLPYVKSLGHWVRQVYSLGYWVESLKPWDNHSDNGSVVRAYVIIGGGAKCDKEGAALIPFMPQSYLPEKGILETSIMFDCGSIEIMLKFVESTHKYYIMVKQVEMLVVECAKDEFLKMSTFLYHLTKHSCGSLKSYSANKKAHVRKLEESILCYVKNEYPPIYILKLERDLVVKIVE